MFAGAVALARQLHWFLAGKVPDTVEGRFAVLATIVALFVVRLESAGEQGEAASVALTERFIEALDAEIREMGVGDPALGKQVRALVGALAARVEQWRTVVGGGGAWETAVARSVYRDDLPGEEAAGHSRSALQSLWARLEALPDRAIIEGQFE